MTTSIVRHPVLHVYVDGIEVTNRLSAQWAYDYTQRYGSATVRCPFAPAWAKHRSQVVIVAGASDATAVTRFTGFIIHFISTLFPGQVDLVCRGPLFYASQDMNNNPAGIDLSAAGAGQTDQAIVTLLLTDAGVAAYLGAIGGTGKTLGTVATDQYVWAYGQTALDCIDLFDQVCLGYRTFETLGGSIIRTQITANPGPTAAATFTEGVDLLATSNNDSSTESLINQVQVTGYTAAGATGPFNYSLMQSNPYIPDGVVTQTISSNLLESSTTGGTGISCQEVATWLLPELNRGLATLTADTPRDDAIGPGMTIAVNSPARLGVDQNFWVQGISGDVGVTAPGAFTQTLSLIGSALGTGGTGSTTGGVAGGGTIGGGGQSGGGSGGGGGTTGGGGTGPNTPPTVDFSISVDQEIAVVSGAEVALYVVSCLPAVAPGSGAISSYAWTTSGGSPHPASGSDPDFTTSYAAISTQTITLTVTDANGLTGTATKTIPASTAIQYLTRRLFLAGTSDIEDFYGSAWNTAGDASTVVANGPIWASGANVLSSANDLASAPLSVAPFLSGTVTALWFENSYSHQFITAGSSNGAVATSLDGGATWSIMAQSPSAGNAILRVVKSRSVAGQYFALTAGGLFRSDNSGNGWVTVVAAAGGETFRDVSVSFARILIAMAGGRLLCDQAGVAQTLPAGMTADIYAVTADIRRDRFYSYDSAGHTAYHAADGGTTLGARAALPVPAAIRGLWRDEHVRGLLYFAAGSAYKSVDGLGSSGGYYRLRQPGVGSAPGGASYAQIGIDGVLVTTLHAYTVTVQINTGTGDTTVITTPSGAVTLPAAKAVAYNLWTGSANNTPPVGWFANPASEVGWITAVGDTPVNGYWTSAAPLSTSQQILFRQHVTLPAGTIVSATLHMDAGATLLGGYLNNKAIPSFSSYYNATHALDPALFIPGADNVFAVWGQAGVFSTDAYISWQLTVTYV